ncbi:MAG TPA: helix-turn-helix domain-containing protein [Anaerolineaceae bacterium]|nr:helix-turn-helix domain-containing protein [Anaerolineaceae bacterium]
MTDPNFDIAQRIRAARLQRNLTQQDLADKFNKTSAAISDIERGKTQISASDLIVFSELLAKPIEYFYGEDFSDAEIEDVIALMRRLPPDIRKQQLPLMTMFLRMAEINYEMQNTDDKEKQMEAVKEFYELFLPYYESMESMMLQLREAKTNIESLLS